MKIRRVKFCIWIFFLLFKIDWSLPAQCCSDWTDQKLR